MRTSVLGDKKEKKFYKKECVLGKTRDVNKEKKCIQGGQGRTVNKTNWGVK